MIAGLSGRGLSATTVRYAHAVLRIALGRALKSGRVVRNVATLVDAPARASREIRPLTAEQVGTFLANVDGDRLAALYVTALGTGLRQGELLGLRWQDVDLDAGTLTVRHSLALRSRQLVEPKTERSRRTLRLGSQVLGALREQRRDQLGERLAAGPRWADLDYVFATPAGQPLDSSNVLHAFQRTLARIGLPRQRFHDLRHACATLLLEQGEELGVVSKVLGHATVGTTADVYAGDVPAGRRSDGRHPAQDCRRLVVGYGVGYVPKNDPRRIARRGSFRDQNGGPPGGIRTPDLLIRSQSLYPLSYGRSLR